MSGFKNHLLAAGCSLLALLPAIAFAQSVSFTPATNFTAGNGPNSVAMGDLNGDGKPDLAVANRFGNSVYSVSILLGTGGGVFPPATDFPVGNGPLSVAIGDLNGDGKPDLAVGNDFGGHVSVMLGVGAGSFGPALDFAADFAAGSSGRSVAIADLNGDGKPDLVVVNRFGNGVSILLGNGAGSFALAVNFPVGTGPRGVAIGDFNGDGKPDMAVANQDTDNVSILLQKGSIGGISFVPASNFAAGDGAFWVAAGDLNGDGKLDLAVANRFDNSVSILLGNGAGAFGPAANFSLSLLGLTPGTEPFSLAIADLNGDGKLDLATANTTSHNVSILLGNGSGSFVLAASRAVGTTPVFAALGDLNGDGRPDLAVANQGSNNVSILLNTTPFTVGGFFASQAIFAAGNKPRSVALADLTGDGKQDLAVVNAGDNTIAVLIGLGTGAFQGPNILCGIDTSPSATECGIGTVPSAVGIADFNGDGIPDLAVANAGNNTISVLIGLGAGKFQAPTILCGIDTSPGATDCGAGTSPSALAIGDLNRDGKPDLAVANAGNNTISIFLGTGAGTFQGPNILCGIGTSPGATDCGIGTIPSAVGIADFNGDGKPDLAVANAGNSTISVFLGTGTGAFQPPIILCGVGTSPSATDCGAGTSPSALAIGDLNRDGKPDLAVANTGNGTVSTFLGIGTGAFKAPTILCGVGTSPGVAGCLPAASSTALAREDLNRLATNSFSPSAAGTSPSAVAIADVNGDGKPDLIVTNSATNSVTVLPGDGAGSFGTPTNLTVGAGPVSVAVGDLNGDGKPELVVANAAGNSVSVLMNPPTIIVTIDIKPGSFPNSINLGSGGTVPVAIFSTPAFDARTVDPATVTLASAPAKLKGKAAVMASFEDVNADGLLDLVVHVSTEALQLTAGDSEAVLEGKTFGGTAIRGTDSIRVVP